MKKLFLGAILFVLSITSSFAASTELTFDDASKSYVSDFSLINSVFTNGQTSLDFTLPVSAGPGVYHVTATFGGSGIDIDWGKTNLNGATGAPVFTAPGVDFGFITTNTTSPFNLNIYGIEVGSFHALGGHIDAYMVTPAPVPSVSSVPEPESYAMFIAGISLLFGIARRRS